MAKVRKASPRRRQECARPVKIQLNLEVLEDRVVPTGTWTSLAHLAPSGTGTMMLLSDGRPMVQGPDNAAVKTWFALTPDSSGSYVNGTWSPLGSMNLERLYYGSNMLPDGRVFVVGGEYSGPGTTQNFTRTGEIYDPLANSWTSIANFPQSQFGDDPTELLPDGRVLGGYLNGPQTYIYDPSSNTWTLAANKLRGDRSDEETWITLPDGSILSYDVFGSTASAGHAQRYIPSTNTWVDAGSVPVYMTGSNVGFELGPGFLLPDGRVFQLGANGHTAFYTPSTNTWTAGPDIPNNLGCDDAPGAMLPNGNVLFAADRFSPLFTGPTSVFEFDPTTNTYTNVTPPISVINLSGAAYVTRMLVLPTGQVLMTSGSNKLAIYTPDGSADPSWQPTVSSVTDNGDGTFALTGTQLNGISEGACYGDDAEMSSNYPIIQLVDPTGQVFYARTFNWSSTGVATGSTVETVNFTVPPGVDLGSSTLYVIANGIASAPFATTGSPLPPGWTSTDIGSPGQAGSAAFDGTTWTVQGGGADIAGTADQFQYAYESVSGDTTIIGRVTVVQNGSDSAKAGVMIRDGTDPSAAYVAVLQLPNNQVVFQWRDSAGADSDGNGSLWGDTSNVKWVELVQSGDTFSAYYAATVDPPTDSDWVFIDSHTVAMSAPTAGLAVTAADDTALCTANFTDVSVTSAPGPQCPPPAPGLHSGRIEGPTRLANSRAPVPAPVGGVLISAVFDATRPVTWGIAGWTANPAAGDDFMLQTRSGQTPSVDGPWSAWPTVAGGQTANSLAGYASGHQLTLTSTDRPPAPVVFDVDFLWN